MSDTTSPAPPSRFRQMVRGLRPLLLWLLLVLVLFAIRTHERLSEQTHVSFRTTLQGRPVGDEVTVMFDAKPITSGERVSIGRHRLTLRHPKAEPFSTNLFIWYGERDLGDIVLHRSQGTLIVHADPPAEIISIRGPELALTLTNSPGTKSVVPSDRYSVEVKYLHFQQTREIEIVPNQSRTVAFEPRMGAVLLTCNQASATFQLLKADGQLLGTGDFPSTIRDLPQGNYKVIAWHHQNQGERTLAVKAGITNALEVEFAYGAAVLETDPPGAVVTGSDGHEWGHTPLRLGELKAGPWKFNLRRDGFEAVSVAIEVLALQTNVFRTNLVNIDYANSMKSAREYLAAESYDAAREAASAALQAKPNDPEATALQKAALGKNFLRRAEAFGKQGDYTAGIRQLESALQVLPKNEEAKQLFADFKNREPEQIERERVERLERPKKIFESVARQYPDAALFDRHELKTGKSAREAEQAIYNALGVVRPIFHVKREKSPGPYGFMLEATQQLPTFLGSPTGYRKCLIVGTQTKNDETQIVFKVMEYKAEAVDKYTLGALIGAPGAVTFVPVHPSQLGALSEKLQAQVRDGVRVVTERIQAASGQAR